MAANLKKQVDSFDIDILNKPESIRSIIARLKKKACGKRQEISVVDAVEFRREQYALNAHQFSAILGIQSSHYSEFVNHKRSLPIKAMRRAFAIGVPAAVLLQPQRRTQS